MDLEGGKGCYKTLRKAQDDYKDQPNDADVLEWVNSAKQKVWDRMTPEERDIELKLEKK
jgi:hypothetical protein